MMNLLSALYDDEAGAVVSTELILIITLMVLGMIVGLSDLASSINDELLDVGSAVENILNDDDGAILPLGGGNDDGPGEPISDIICDGPI